ncbi:MAG: hypothetical protein PHN49_10975 [Candidatus Omnitrophica bacterium]|nr:hypothetical protein [Candidatus Omnitrophota bacterium]
MVYLPFWNRLDMIYRFWDGPHYAYTAKFLYQVPDDNPMRIFNLPSTYYASHLPMVSLLIRLVAVFAGGNYFLAMLIAGTLTSIVAALLFLRILQVYSLVHSPGWTAFLFCFLPPTWLVYHSVGASEPLFLVFCFASLLAYKGKQPWLIVLFIALASWTRITGILLVPIFAVLYLRERNWGDLTKILIAGLALPLLFGFYYLSFGDFFAVLHGHPEKLSHMSPIPFTPFLRRLSDSQTVVEYVIYFYLINALGTLYFIKRNTALFIFCSVFYLFEIFHAHFHISRYFLPLMPFTFLVAFDSLLSNKAVRWLVPVLVIFCYLYVWNRIPNNLAPPEFFQAVDKALHG